VPSNLGDQLAAFVLQLSAMISILAVIFPAVLAAVVGVLGFRMANQRAAADRKHSSEEAERDRRAQADQARLDRAIALERLNAEHRNQRELAAEERRQERIADTYLLILDALDAWSAWMAELDDNTDTRMPGVSDPHAGSHSLSARVTAFASVNVTRRFSSLQMQVSDISACAARVRELLADESLSPGIQERKHGTTFTREMRRLDQMRRDAQDVIRGLRELIRTDLGTESDDTS